MSDEKIDVKVGAQTEGIEAGMRNAASAVQEAASSMHESLGGLAVIAGAVSGAVEELIQQLIVGLKKALTSGTDTMKDVAKETRGLMSSFGIASDEASVLRVALGDIGVETDAARSAFGNFVRQVRTNSEGLKAYGIDVKAMKEQGMSTVDMFQVAINKLGEYKAGLDQQEVAQKLFRSSVDDALKMQKLDNAAKEEAKNKIEELGLGMTKYSLSVVGQFKQANNDVRDVFEALSLQVGRAVMPLLTDLMNWFSSLGPNAIQVFKVVLASVAAIFYGLEMAASITWNAIAAAIEVSTVNVLRFVEAASKAVQLDFTGAKEAWDRGAQQIEEIATKRLNNIAATAYRVNAAMKGLIDDDSGAAKPKGGTKSAPETNTATNDQFKQWQQELQKLKDVSDMYRGMELKEEIAFWADKVGRAKKGSEEQAAALHEYWNAVRQSYKASEADEKASYTLKKAAAEKNKEELVRLAEEQVQSAKQKYRADSIQYKQALAEKLKAEETFKQEVEKIQKDSFETRKQLALNSVSMERDRINFLKDMGFLDGVEKVQQEKALAEQEYQIKREALVQEAENNRLRVTEHQQTLNKLKLLDAEYSRTTAQLEQQSALAVKQKWDGVFSAVQSAFGSSIQGIIQGTTTLQKALTNMAMNIGLTLVQELAIKPAVAFLQHQVLMTLGMMTEDQKKVASAAVTSAEMIGIQNAANVAMAASYAGVAGAAGVASAAAIPVVGWAMAPAAGAMDYAAAMTYAGMASFDVGSWSVPKDMVAKVHEGETIMPKPFAEEYRQNAKDGGMGTGMQINVKAMDSRDVIRALRQGGTLHKALTQLNRGFAKI